jgi:hypothetical protein
MSKRVSLQGAGDGDAERLRQVLEQSAAELTSTWKFYNGADTDLLIVDIDTVYGHMDWLRAHSSGKPVAVLTEHAQFGDADLILHKPLTAANLIDVLNRADPLILDRPEVARPESEYSPDSNPPPARPAPPAPAAKPVAAAVVVPPPPAPAPPPPEPPRERRLSDWLSDGVLSSPVRLREDGAPELVLDPIGRTFHADASLRALAPYCARTITREQWQDVSTAELATLQAAGKAQPYARLLWLCHALGSNGHLASGLDINAKYKLARWPQIEREFPKHFRIATVMIKQLASLTDIAEQSGAPLADVIDFTNAYNAIGYIEIEGVASSAAPVQRDSGRGAILSRLRNPFGGG